MGKKREAEERAKRRAEANRRNAQKRWAGTSLDQRREATAAANEARQALNEARRRDRLAATLRAIELDEGIGYFLQKAERSRPDLDLEARYRYARTLRREQQRRIRQAGL